MNPKIEIVSPNLAKELHRKITKDLPEYFGLPECNEEYINGIVTRTNFAAKVGEDYVGLLSLDFPYPNNSNIYWMGVLRSFHNQGIGFSLVQDAVIYARNQKAETMTVETLAPEECDENYSKTYQFYLKAGFSPMFNLKPLNYEWNMVYMVLKL